MQRGRYVPNISYLLWLAAVAATVTLLAALGFARVAAAQPLPPSGPALLAGPVELERTTKAMYG